ncbi:M28 family metallopeptidase [Actinomadura rubrisoli]|uniref:Zn-dependent exopeptidase M28 n=1 Tax=Actinomadura rubrisoli TaxID=2530368 RepID=A0A4V2YQY5_9ACTN|nr:M28 family metallopeptidase [Actinomadura rubrisoli]TDD63657.1 Zn-dependent exopeptidase M28 [Actinomadura rubrisoli]
MRTGIALLPDGRDEPQGRAAPPGADWARLDDTVLYWADDDERWQDARDGARSAGVALEERPAPGTSADLHLVTQVGRVFQHEHPDVPVLVDKGRYLVVSLDKGRRDLVRPRAEVCYRVEPLRPGAVVFRSAAPAARRPDPGVQALVDEVSRDSYRQRLAELVAFETRHSLSDGFRAAAGMAAGVLRDLGYMVEEVPVEIGQGRSLNLVADRLAASRLPREVVVVTAHLDSINLQGGPAAPAPGADDNGSGAAGLLEIARVLAGAPLLGNDLRLILFGGEEEGLFGSTQYVASLPPDQRAGIRSVINMDMIATLNTATPTVLLEGAEVSARLMDELAVAAATYTSLGVQTSLRPFNSDHVPFIDASIPAVLTIEGADGANENIHTAGDTLDAIDEELALDIVRMNTAATAAALA